MFFQLPVSAAAASHVPHYTSHHCVVKRITVNLTVDLIDIL